MEVINYNYLDYCFYSINCFIDFIVGITIIYGFIDFSIYLLRKIISNCRWNY